MGEGTAFERVLFAIALYTFFGGLYVVLVSFFLTSTLPLQLTHLTPWLRTDTFGIVCWIVSFFTFLMWNIIRA